MSGRFRLTCEPLGPTFWVTFHEGVAARVTVELAAGEPTRAGPDHRVLDGAGRGSAKR